MDAMPMPGGARMSLAWMPVCGRSSIADAASFLGMWILMMAVMMLPSLVSMLRRYRRAIGRTGALPSAMSVVLVAGGYLLTWALIGAAVYPLRAAIMAFTLLPARASTRAVPIAIALIVSMAGALQFTRWKARQLACCREDCGRQSLECAGPLPVDAVPAWRYGLRLGLHCSRCCAGLTAALLVTGFMNWPGMLAATAAINLERLAPAGERVARIVGTVVIGAGLLLCLRASGF